MPVITIEIVPQDYEKKEEISKVFTEELSRITGIPQDPVTVIFHDVSPQNVSFGGKMLDQQFKDEQS